MKTSKSPSAPFELAPLPWKDDALAPLVSANTIRFHYGKHHKGYVDNLNRLVAGNALSELSLEQLVRETANVQAQSAIYNNAAQAWNHDFYWQSLNPGRDMQPSGALKLRITDDFGSYDAFKEQFTAAAMGQFGSGWAWLVVDAGKLKITRTANADTPMAAGKSCLLAIDVWEHAYYLDYQNRRADHVAAVIENLLHWDFAAKQFASAQSDERAL
jgi:Fe-Mn family superoxide dismutase